MSFTIALAGKGGTGKTTLAALIIETLRREGKKPLLAVDADPNANLADWLGIKYTTTIADIIEETKGLRNLPNGLSKPIYLEYQLQRCLAETPSVDLLVMGRPEGPECYCMANNILRGYINELVKNYAYIVIDNEAGMEHISRKLTQNIDVLFLVSHPTRLGLRTAKRIKELIDKLSFLAIRQHYLVLNLVRDSFPFETELPLELIGTLPYDEEIPQLELMGEPIGKLPDNSSLLTATKEILKKVGIS